MGRTTKSEILCKYAFKINEILDDFTAQMSQFLIITGHIEASVITKITNYVLKESHFLPSEQVHTFPDSSDVIHFDECDQC